MLGVLWSKNAVVRNTCCVVVSAFSTFLAFTEVPVPMIVFMLFNIFADFNSREG